MNEHRHYLHHFEHGRVEITIPKKMSADEVQDLREHFGLVLQQAARGVLIDDMEKA